MWVGRIVRNISGPFFTLLLFLAIITTAHADYLQQLRPTTLCTSNHIQIVPSIVSTMGHEDLVYACDDIEDQESSVLQTALVQMITGGVPNGAAECLKALCKEESRLIACVIRTESENETCSYASPATRSFVQHTSPRDAWLHTLLHPSLRGVEGGACNPIKSFCFSGSNVPSSSVPFTEIAVMKALPPDSLLTSKKIIFPTAIIPSGKSFCSTTTEGRKTCQKSKELFALLLAELKKEEYLNSRVTVEIEDGDYEFEAPSTKEELTGVVPSIALYGLRDVEIKGVGSPLMKFSNTRSSGVEIHDSQRLTIKNISFTYNFSVDFSKELKLYDLEEDFTVSPYGTSFFDGRITSDEGTFELISPQVEGATNLAKDFRAGFYFTFNSNKSPFRIPIAEQPNYFLSPQTPGATTGFRADMFVFDKEPVTKTSTTQQTYSYEQLRGTGMSGTTITIGKQRSKYLQAIFLRDVIFDSVTKKYEFRPNSDINFEDLKIFKYPQMGIVSHGGSRFRLHNVKIVPGENDNHSGRADAIHLAGTTDIELEGNTIRGQGDDGLNIRGFSATIFDLESSHQCTLANNVNQQALKVDFRRFNRERNQMELPNLDSTLFRPGDNVMLVSNGFSPLVNGRIESVSVDVKGRPITARIVFGTQCGASCICGVLAAAREGRGGVEHAAVLFNMTRSGARYYVHGRNKFQFSASRGVLLQAPHGVFEDNFMTGLPGSGIRIQAENNAAGVAGPGAVNVVVRRNKIQNVNFDRSSYPLYQGAISIGSLDDPSGLTSFPLVQRVIVQDNEIKGVGHAAVAVSQARQIELSWTNSDPSKIWIAGCYRAGKLSAPDWGGVETPTIGIRNSASVSKSLAAHQVAGCGILQ